jgi:hypothetical protein
MTGRAVKGTWGNLGRQKEKEMLTINGLRLMDQNWSQPLTIKTTLPYLHHLLEKEKKNQKSKKSNEILSE